MSKSEKLATEVCLVWEVMTCLGQRATYDPPGSPCHWFKDHYGPYGAYSSEGEDPATEMRTDKKNSFQAISRGKRYNVPEILSGCRKAPIMSIGINPNLTAYQHGINGTTWCYPYFDDIVKYATHFRYRTVNQDHFTLEFIKEHLEAGTEIVAEADGEIVGMSLKNNVLALNIEYRDGERTTLRLTEDYVLLYDTHKSNNAGEMKNVFKKGEVIAGKLALPEDVATKVVREPVGYYQRFQGMIKSFKAMGDDRLRNSQVRLGEDASMGDMVSCASPGWEAYFPGAVLEGIVQECVMKKQHFRKQVIQSRPVVVVFSGEAALQMFLEVFPTEVTPKINNNQTTYQRLRDCLTTPYILEFSDGEETFKSRMIFSPHFSYPDSFDAGCRLTNHDWNTFEADYPADAILVKKEKNTSYSGIFVAVNPEQEPYASGLSSEGKEFLASHYIDPIDTIGKILLEEYTQDKLKLDASGKHLMRTDGPCQFCDNSLFQVGHGCKYGKI